MVPNSGCCWCTSEYIYIYACVHVSVCVRERDDWQASEARYDEWVPTAFTSKDLGVGAEKSSSYRLGFRVVMLTLIFEKGNGLIKELLSPCWLLVCSPTLKKWIKRGLLMSQPFFYYSLPPPSYQLKVEVAEARPKSDLWMIYMCVSVCVCVCVCVRERERE